MLWSSDKPGRRLRKNTGLPLVLIAVAVFTSAADSPSIPEKHLSIYSTVANYSLPMTDRNRQDYVGLLEVLDPLGKVTARTDGKHWRVRFNDADIEFTPGKKRVRIGRLEYELPANFLLEGDHGLVPLSSLPQLLSHILGGPVTLHESSFRLFIGNAGVHFTAQVTRTSNPALVINFTAPVNPTIATETGKLHMHFTREALVAPGSPMLTFDNKTIPSASYEENNGTAEITVNGSAPLFAAFSNDRRTITITAPPQTAVQTQSKTAAPSAAVPGAGSSGTTSGTTAFSPSTGSTFSPISPNSPVPVQRQYFAVVDASHGGDERGAALNDQLAEKDVTLAFARQLRQQLENRGITTLLLRDGDINLSLDQRAGQTNSAHPAIYICVHAASQGMGIRLYTALMPAGGDSHGPFISWDSAQASSLSASQTAAASVAVELHNKQIPVRTLAAPLRPLNNITTAAIALEIAPPGEKIADLSSPDYQQLVTSTVAAGILDARPKLEAAP
jgi:N-acetylmuramoyl-L-alanine amidase